jgi:hypothetical protein
MFIKKTMYVLLRANGQFWKIINLVKELFEIEKEKMFVHFKISSYLSHN